MIRILQNTSTDITETFSVNGVATDCDGDVAVIVTRENGTMLTAGAGVPTGNDGEYRFALSAPSDTAALDVLTATWAGEIGGDAQTITSVVEICGGYLTSLAELRKTPPLDSAVKYPTADVIFYRTLAETALEDACGLSFVPRYFHVKVDGSGLGDVLLPARDGESDGPGPRPLSVTSVVMGASSSGVGTTLSADDLSDLELYRDGRIYNPNGWPRGRRNVEIIGTCGYKAPPPRVSLAVRKLVKRWLVDSPIADRATALTNQDGQFQFMLTAGIKDNVFDVPEALAVVDLYGVNFGIA